MNWSYSGNPQASSKDEVRFLIGDTDPDDTQFSDAEVEYAIAAEGSPLFAAARCCESLAGKFSRQADRRVGDMALSASQRAKAYREQAAQLRELGNRFVAPILTGMNKADKLANDNDTSVVQPTFFRNMMDNPRVFPQPQPGGGPDQTTWPF